MRVWEQEYCCRFVGPEKIAQNRPETSRRAVIGRDPAFGAPQTLARPCTGLSEVDPKGPKTRFAQTRQRIGGKFSMKEPI